MIVTGTAFRQDVEALGFKCWDPRDQRLFCPSEAWLKDFAAFLDTIRKPPKKESRDCDDYAMWSVTQASEACAAALDDGHTLVYCTVRLWGTLNGIEPEAQNISGHATNLVKLSDEDSPLSTKLVFFEPQTGKYCDAKTAIRDGVVVPVNALL